jgi:hypothetical protein
VQFDNRTGSFKIAKRVAGGASAAEPPQTSSAPRRSADQVKAAYEAHTGDFDYLLGDWEFTAESKEYGKFRGYWSAGHLEKGQILDAPSSSHTSSRRCR